MGVLALATEALLGARWILSEELGILSPSEEEAARGDIDPLFTRLNSTSERLMDLASTAGDADSAGDGFAREIVSSARALLAADGARSAEALFFRAAERAISELHAAAVLTHEKSVLEETLALIPLLEERVKSYRGVPSDRERRLGESVEELMVAWRALFDVR